MADWIGGDGHSTATTYRVMAETQLRGYSAAHERTCLGVANDPEIVALINQLPRPKRQPNLFLAALRYLRGPQGRWDETAIFVRERWDDVEQVMRSHATQTNEPNRCATLLPLLASLPQPLALLEVGASAGLCLFPDRYGYAYATDGQETRLGTGSPLLRCELTGIAPPVAVPQVVWRAGLDLNPLDVAGDDDARWLHALVWPEQTDRQQRLREAITLARTDPPRVVAGDLTRDLAPLAAEAPRDAMLVIFHSAVLAYVPTETRQAFYDTVRNLAADRPVTWISNEGRGVVPGTEVELDRPDRFVVAVDGKPVALASPHGQQYVALA